VLVLRYWEQLTDAETAAVLGCAEGTVKSAGSRGLARLRELAADWDDTAAMCGRDGKRSWTSTSRTCSARAWSGSPLAIELTSRPDSPISETVWVSPGTYLPVRVVIRIAPGLPVLQQTADIIWLPATAQNLAKLTVPIPAGFRRVPLAQAVTPILPQILGPPGRPGCVSVMPSTEPADRW
jgi:Sigma-70, region 4